MPKPGNDPRSSGTGRPLLMMAGQDKGKRKDSKKMTKQELVKMMGNEDKAMWAMERLLEQG